MLNVTYNNKIIGQTEGLSIELEGNKIIGRVDWLVMTKKHESFDIVKEWVFPFSFWDGFRGLLKKKQKVSLLELRGCLPFIHHDFYEDDEIIKYTGLIFTVKRILKSTEER